MKFWDSSAIVPLLIDEQYSNEIKLFYSNDKDIVVWMLTPIEILSAFNRKIWDKSISEKDWRRVEALFDKLVLSWNEVVNYELVRKRAKRLIFTHNLKAADSLQLAAALVATKEQPDRLDFVTLDNNLSKAAKREGFNTLPEH